MEKAPKIPAQEIENWTRYYEQTKERPPAELLREAITYLKRKDNALDLGAGALVESRFLLDQGFGKVIAIDQMPLAPLEDSRFQFEQSSFEDYRFPEKFFDLVNAEKALPFIHPEALSKVWEQLRMSLTESGVFSGQFFGDHDSWHDDPRMNFQTLESARALLEGLEILKFEETERDGTTAAGSVKHWHVFNIIARA